MKFPTPTNDGHYWAKWRICDEGTADEDVFTPHKDWEVVKIVHNGGDDENDLYRVSVTGVAMSQHIDNFIWGPEVVMPKEIGGDQLYEGDLPVDLPDTPEIRAALKDYVVNGNNRSTRERLIQKIITLVAIRRKVEA